MGAPDAAPHLLPEHQGHDLYPTVWLLDPFGTFTTAAGIATTTALLAFGHLPPVAIIGVGPREVDLATITAQRMLDLTPSPTALPHVAAAAPLGTGGAQVVLDLLVEELAPRLESRYPLDPSRRTVAGWSLGGLFSCYALMQRPDHFQQALAVSPSLWWNDGELIDSPTNLAGRRIYLAAGEHERDHTQAWPAVPEAMLPLVEAYPINMVEDVQHFSVSAGKAGADVRTDILAGEHHVTVWAAAFTRGLVHLFRTDPMRLTAVRSTVSMLVLLTAACGTTVPQHSGNQAASDGLGNQISPGVSGNSGGSAAASDSPAAGAAGPAERTGSPTAIPSTGQARLPPQMARQARLLAHRSSIPAPL